MLENCKVRIRTCQLKSNNDYQSWRKLIQKLYNIGAMKKNYDYLIVGAGLFGAVAAHELNKRGYKVLVYPSS